MRFSRASHEVRFLRPSAFLRECVASCPTSIRYEWRFSLDQVALVMFGRKAADEPFCHADVCSPIRQLLPVAEGSMLIDARRTHAQILPKHNATSRFLMLLIVVMAGMALISPTNAAAKPGTAVALTLSSASVTSGTVVTFTAAVSNPSPVTSGLVTFCNAAATYCDGSEVIGTAQLTSAGTAVIKRVLPIGSHSYKAVFSGNTTALAASSSAQPLTVSGSYASATSISSSGSAGSYTLTGTVVGYATPAPSATVSFVDTTDSYVVGSAILGAATQAQTFGAAATYATGTHPQAVAVGDFNGDGIPDIAVANNSSANVNVFLGNANGTFTLQSSPTVGSHPSAIAVGDFNGDGNLDLVIANNGVGTITVLLGNGTGNFPTTYTYSVGSYPQSVAVGDFNGDGIPDLAVANASSSTVSVLLGNGDGTFQTAVPYSTGTGPQSVAIGDFRGDGKLDLAVANYGVNTVSVLLGNGDGTFQTRIPYATGTYSFSVAVGDFNGDGISDLAVANFGGATLSVLLGNGDGTFQPQVAYTTGTEPIAPAVADFNGDGLADLAFANYGNNNVAVTLSSVTQTAAALASGISIPGNGAHQVEASFPGDGNYSASLSSTISLSTSAVTTNLALSTSLTSSTYGQSVVLTATLNPSTTGSLSANGETVTFKNGSTTIGTGTLSLGVATLTLSTLPAGTNVLTAVYGGDANFKVSTSSATNVAVSKAALTVTGTDSKVYGQSRTYGAGSTAFTSSGLQNGESIGSVTISANGGASATASVGSYTLTPSAATGGSFSAANYTITYQSGTLSVTPAPLSITANSVSKFYGQTMTYGAGSTAFTSSGLLNDQSITVTITASGGTAADATPGAYTLSPSAATGTTFVASNYTISYNNGTLTVTKATPVLDWGNPLPAVSYGTALSGSQLNATSGGVAGTFVYTPAAGTLLGPGAHTLSVTFTPTNTTGYSSQTATTSLTISQAPLDVTATSAVGTYGQPLPAFGYMITGFVNGDTQASATTGTPGESVAATPASAPGSYWITVSPGTLSSTNYSFGTFVPGYFYMQQAPSTVALNLSGGTLKATVSVTGLGGAPTQTVTFYYGETSLGTGTLSAVDANHASASVAINNAELGFGVNRFTAVYGGDTNYLGSTSPAYDFTVQTAPVALGTFGVGGTSPVEIVSYTFSATTTLSAVNILTAGAPGLDYADAGGSSCVAGASYNSGDSCDVYVQFTPSAPGVREGGVTLFAQGQTLPLMTAYLSGIGQSSAVTIDPGAQSSLATLSNSGQAYGAAVDGAGNVYVVDQANSAIVKLAANTYTSSTVLTSARLLNPTAVAIDGAGNLYVSDTGHSRVVVVPNEQGALNVADLYAVAISGLGSPRGIALDGSGNLYVADATNGVVFEIPAGGGTASVVASGLTSPQGVAVDASSNVYVSGNNLVTEYPAGGGSAVPYGTGYSNPLGVAVDASGALYVADSGNNQIVVVAPGGASQTSLPTGTITAPRGVSLDAFANVYVSVSGSVYEVNRTQAMPLTFPLTYTGYTSALQVLTFTDAGNQALAFSGVNAPADFSQEPSGGADCSTSTQLSAAGQCLLAIAATPTTTGALAEAFILSDNALNTTSTQTIQLHGSALYTQTITFPTMPSVTYGVAPFSISASSSSGLPVTLTSSTTSICTASGTSPVTVTVLQAGACTIHATQAGGSGYAVAPPVAQNLTIAHEAQTITLPTISAQTLLTGSITVNATSDSGLPVALTSGSTSICTVSGSATPYTVNLLALGNCSLTASQAGTAAFSAVAVGRTFAVTLAPQTITLSANPGTQIYGAPPFTVTASSTSGLPVAINSNTPSICSASGTSSVSVTLLQPGYCSIQASQAGNSLYAVAPVASQGFTITPASQSITFAAISAQTLQAVSITVNPTSNSGLPVALASNSTSVCTVSGSAAPYTVNLLIPGTCSLTATQPGAAGLSAAPPFTRAFLVTLVPQAITFPVISAVTYGVAPFPVSATSNSGLPVTLATTTPTICSLAGTSPATLTANQAGICSIQATQAGNGYYAAASFVAQNVTISHESQTITFASIAQQVAGGSVQVAATSNSGLPVTLTPGNSAICTVSGSTSPFTVNLVAPGTCSLTATQLGNVDFAPALAVAQTFLAVRQTQTITFASPTATTLLTGSITVNPTANSGLPVALASNSTSVCTVSGSAAPYTVNLLTVGTCSLTASQPGTVNISAATSVTHAFSVTLISQAITFPAITAVTYGAVPFTVSATSNSGLPVTLTTVTPTICSIAGMSPATVTVIQAGSCTIHATQAGNTYYAAANMVAQNLTINHSSQTISFAAISSQPLSTGSITLSPTANSGLAVTLTSGSTSVCTVTAPYTVNLLTAGTCKLTATQSGNVDYSAASAVARSFTVSAN